MCQTANTCEETKKLDVVFLLTCSFHYFQSHFMGVSMFCRFLQQHYQSLLFLKTSPHYLSLCIALPEELGNQSKITELDLVSRFIDSAFTNFLNGNGRKMAGHLWEVSPRADLYSSKSISSLPLPLLWSPPHNFFLVSSSLYSDNCFCLKVSAPSSHISQVSA